MTQLTSLQLKGILESTNNDSRSSILLIFAFHETDQNKLQSLSKKLMII